MNRNTSPMKSLSESTTAVELEAIANTFASNLQLAIEDIDNDMLRILVRDVMAGTYQQTAMNHGGLAGAAQTQMLVNHLAASALLRELHRRAEISELET